MYIYIYIYIYITATKAKVARTCFHMHRIAHKQPRFARYS